MLATVIRLLEGSMWAGPEIAWRYPGAAVARAGRRLARATMLLAALMVCLGVLSHPSMARDVPAPTAMPAGAEAAATIVRRLTRGSFALTDGSGAVLGTHKNGDGPVEAIAESSIIEALEGAHLTPEQAAALWTLFADLDNVSVVTLPIVKSLVAASDTPKAREALWSQLAGLAGALGQRDRRQERGASLLGVFERNRDALLALAVELRETESSGDDIIEIMRKSRVFGADIDESVARVTRRIPAAMARHIERQRHLNRPDRWEYAAFDTMVRWKNERLLPGAAKAPRTLAELDAAGEAFVTMFNCLHALNEGYREVMLRGLGPVELFNVVVAGEQELYRLGTSGYRGFLHAIIMRGIAESGSFEAFIDRALPRRFGEDAVRAAGRRGMVFMRVVSSFGLLDGVLATVRDRDRFVSDAIASLGDPGSFEGNSSVVMDVLTAPAGSPSAIAFKRALLDQLYARQRTEHRAALSSVYGSMLSVYQTVAGDHRDAGIDRDFAIDVESFSPPFERLFSPDGKGGFTHTMFMRMDEDVDAVESYASFRTLMQSLGALVRGERYFDVFGLAAPGRSIEIYVNKPSALGVRLGIARIGEALRDRRVETVIGRGHTSIIAPLQAHAKRVLGDRVKDVAAVFVGSCGGDASVRELIATFGYKPFFTTKSTGRKAINNALIKGYVAALMALGPGDRLSMAEVLERSVMRFTRLDDEDLRTDAEFYQVNMTTVLTAYLFDTHVSRDAEPNRYAARALAP